MKILIVEDETKLAQSLSKGLRQEGYTVDHIGDGNKAEECLLLSPEGYDLLLLDITLPGKNGLEICKDLRAKNIAIPILMLTARDTKQDIVSGLNQGADDYLVKPFSFEELLARIRSLARRQSKQLIQSLKTHDLVLYPQTRKVLLREKELTLTFKEFNILEFLMRHPGEVVSREALLSNVWDTMYDSFSNVVDVHIKNLRKKLNTKNHDEILETVRRVGYKLKA